MSTGCNPEVSSDGMLVIKVPAGDTLYIRSLRDFIPYILIFRNATVKLRGRFVPIFEKRATDKIHIIFHIRDQGLGFRAYGFRVWGFTI